MSDGIRDGLNFTGKGQPVEYQRPAMRRILAHQMADGSEARTLFLTDRFPRVVTLCGSTKFAEEYVEATRRETLAGRIVVSVGLFGHQEGIDMGGPVKVALDELHLRKIDLADEVLIVSRQGYIGESTRRELAYARATGKRVRWDEVEQGKMDMEVVG